MRLYSFLLLGKVISEGAVQQQKVPLFIEIILLYLHESRTTMA